MTARDARSPFAFRVFYCYFSNYRRPHFQFCAIIRQEKLMSNRYNPAEIEPKWQAAWEEQGLYDTVEDPSRPKWYALTMLPYPSGNLHVGHWYAMTPSDAAARWRRMN